MNVLTATVTELKNDFGMIGENIFFLNGVVKGPMPKVNDRVLVQMELAIGMPFKYIARRVQVLCSNADLFTSTQNANTDLSLTCNSEVTAEAKTSQLNSEAEYNAAKIINPDIVCRKCQKKGHIQKYCPNPRDRKGSRNYKLKFVPHYKQKLKDIRNDRRKQAKLIADKEIQKSLNSRYNSDEESEKRKYDKEKEKRKYDKESEKRKCDKESEKRKYEKESEKRKYDKESEKRKYDKESEKRKYDEETSSDRDMYNENSIQSKGKFSSHYYKRTETSSFQENPSHQRDNPPMEVDFSEKEVAEYYEISDPPEGKKTQQPPIESTIAENPTLPTTDMPEMYKTFTCRKCQQYGHVSKFCTGKRNGALRRKHLKEEHPRAYQKRVLATKVHKFIKKLAKYQKNFGDN